MSWLPLFALALVAGCAFDSPTALTVSNSCASDADCVQGFCDGKICVDDSGASVTVAIEVLHRTGEVQEGTPASWAFDPKAFSGPSAQELVLPATREVRGRVRWDGIQVPATVRFVRQMAASVAPLDPVPVDASTERDPEATREYDYSATLVAGETYDVVVLPSDDMVMMPMEDSAPAIRSLPPLYLELSVEASDAGEPLIFDLSFPASIVTPCADELEVGCTLEARVLSVDDQVELPEPGLQVRAIERNTGRVVSSIAETDALGRFAIRISETSPDYLIRVTSSVGQEPFPSVSVDPDLAFDGSQSEKTIHIPRLPRVQFRGEVRDENDKAVPVATVRFLSTGIFDVEELGLQGSFGATATSDERGTFQVELLPGFYTVTVTPPEDVENAWGALASDTAVGEDIENAQIFVVPPQVGLHGWVTSFAEEAVPGATVFASARRDSMSREVHRSQEAASNSLGAFEMSIDAGKYDLSVKVPPEAGFPWLVEPELVMSGDQGDLLRRYELMPPIPVEGHVRNSTGVPVSNAVVRAYVLMSDEQGTRPIQVAETSSDAQGRYRLLIAPRLDVE